MSNEQLRTERSELIDRREIIKKCRIGFMSSGVLTKEERSIETMIQECSIKNEELKMTGRVADLVSGAGWN